MSNANETIQLAAAEPHASARHDSWAWLSRNRVAVLLALILLLAAVFRFTGVKWDDDQHLHPDERFLTMVSSTIRLPSSLGEYFDTDKSPMNPYNNNFGSFVYGTAPLFVVRIAAELVHQTDYWNINIVGRVISALFDLFTCAMVFAIGRRLFGERVGLFAAFLYACAVLPIQESHFFTVDAFGNVPIALAFWFTLDIAEGKRGWWAYIFAGIALGFAVASRINFAAYAAIIVIAALMRLAALLNPLQRVGLTWANNAPDAAKTYATDAEAVIGEQSSIISEPPNIKTIALGPLIIEIESRARERGEVESNALDTTQFWNALFYVGAGLVFAALASLLIFRVAQPYAFKGLFGLNPKWLDDMKFISQLISGEIDYPPSDQWTGRAAYLFPLYNIFNYGLGIPFATAALGGFVVGVYEILLKREWKHLWLVLWIGGFFLYLGQQFVLVVRYYLPLYPFFAIYAGFFIFWLWDHAKALRVPWNQIARGAVGAFIAAVVGYTLFWAGAFTSIYTRPVSRIAASDWLKANVPPGAVIANEHWDDPLPFGGYQGLTSSSDGLMDNYGEDGPEKRDQLQAWLDEADYIVLSSNRLYLSIPRLPRRYPLTTKYYEWLFNGELGFDKIQEFTSYPQLFGIVINDDSADEAFTVYDHPKVLIFKKTARYSHDNTARLLNSVDLSEIEKLKPIDYVASKDGFRMSPELMAANYAGGTWSDIFNPQDWVNQIPVLAWLVVVWVIGLLAYPYAFVAFRQFTDRGYAFTKTLGVLAFAWLTWTLASYRALPFERTTMLLVLALMLVGAAGIVWFQRDAFAQFLRARWKLLLGIEAVFLAFFALDLAIRYGNPDLWHPWFGGEKPMDFAYLNAVIKTTYFPAYNPWFEGGFINYYYFGQLLSATLVKFIGIVPEVAYNLLLPMFFAMTASGAFGVAFNLMNRSESQETGGSRLALSSLQSPISLRAIFAGLIAAVFVLIIGNLGQVGVLFEGLNKLGQAHGGASGISNFLTGLLTWLGGSEIPVPIGNWYWTATRVIPDTINEFPFFTFVYADLHAHLMALPVTLAALGVAAHAVLNRAQLKWYDLGIAAMVLGSLRAINTWDYPTYLMLIGCAIGIGYFAERRAEDTAEFSWSELIQRYLWFVVLAFVQVAIVVMPTNAVGVRVTLDMAIYFLVLVFAFALGIAKFGLRLDARRVGWDLGWRMVALIALSVLFYLPYILNYGTAYTSVELWKDARTTLSDYIVVHGIFLFLTASYLIVLALNKSARTQNASAAPISVNALLDGWLIYLVPALVVLEVGLLFLGLTVFALVTPLVALAAWILLDKETAPVHRFLALVLLAALLLTLMVEVITLKGDIGRMNTVFKFYLQAWVFFAVADASGLAMVFHSLWFRDPQTDAVTGQTRAGDSAALQTLKAGWWGLAALLILAGMLYAPFAAWAKVHDRFVADAPSSLNGLDYMKQATYNTHDQDIVLQQDYQAIQWLREKIKGSPVLVEANDGLYHWGNRVSINTGLPTIIGWDWHTKQQYSLLPGEIVDNRINDVRTIYETTDPTEALDLMRRFDVSLIYVGPLERALYDHEGLGKFDALTAAGALKKVYDQDGVQIYAVSSQVAQVVK
jgi:YYY domain-containing protein